MQTEVIESVELKEQLTSSHSLILYNDDFNTFDHVIECLVSICKHDVLQAEQCTYLVHYAGKCEVKNGEFEKLKPMKSALELQNLTVEIK